MQQHQQRTQMVDLAATRHISTPMTTRKGTMHIHVVQCRSFRLCGVGVPSPVSSSIGCGGFSLSLRIGSVHSNTATSHPPIGPHHTLEIPPSGEIIWNTEMELPFPSADEWIILQATPSPSASDLVSSSSSSSYRPRPPSGESRIPVKEYESGIYHDVWLTFRRSAASHRSSSDDATSTAYVTGQLQLRFMYQLGYASSGPSPDQSILSQLSPSAGALAHHLLHSNGFWIQVLLQYMDAKGEAGGGDSATKAKELSLLLHSILTLLSHARFSLLLHLIECLVRRELDFLTGQCGRIDSVWASNIFRRNSVSAKIMAMYCASNMNGITPDVGGANSYVREGVGKTYLLHLLWPIVDGVINDVNGGGGGSKDTNTTTSMAASMLAAIQANYFSSDGAQSLNPYEIDPTKLGGNRDLLERNQTLLIQRCQSLLDSILQSVETKDEDGDGGDGDNGDSCNVDEPLVPTSMKWLSRTIRRCVQEYVQTSITTSTINNNVTSFSESSSSDDQTVPSSSSPSTVAPFSSSSLVQVSHESSHNSIASFFFLRFLCPALVTPVHYGLLAKAPPPAASRALILMAKALQSLVNSAGSAQASSRVNGNATTTTTTITPTTTSSSSSSTSPTVPSSSDSTSSTPSSGVVSPAIVEDGTNGSATTTTVAAPSSSSAASSSSTVRLFKEGYMSIFDPFINSNLSRVSTFLDRLSQVDATTMTSTPLNPSDTVRPGVEDEFVGFGSELEDLFAQGRELERCLWNLHGTLRLHIQPLCTLADNMVTSGILLPPRSTPGIHFSGQAAMIELTRPKHADLMARGSGLNHSTTSVSSVGGVVGSISTLPTPILTSPSPSPSSSSSSLNSSPIPSPLNGSTPTSTPSLTRSSSPLLTIMTTSISTTSTPTTIETPTTPIVVPIHTFIARFRSTILALTQPTWLTEEQHNPSSSSNNKDKKSNPKARQPPPSTTSRKESPTSRNRSDASAGTTTTTTTSGGGGSNNPPPQHQNVLAAAASNGLKFFQRLLPEKDKDKEKEKEKSNHQTRERHGGVTNNADSTTTTTNSSSRVTSPTSSRSSSRGVTSGSSSSSSAAAAAAASAHEDLTIFKQTSFEIQLRLSTQLEDCEQRYQQLQHAYNELEIQSCEKDVIIQQLRQQIKMLHQQNINNINNNNHHEAEQQPTQNTPMTTHNEQEA